MAGLALLFPTTATTGQQVAGSSGETSVEAAREPGSALVPIPKPDLDSVDPAVREQIAETRALVDELIEGGVSGPGAAQAFGRLGLTYFVYGILDSAEAALRNAVSLQPGHFPWLYYLGVVQQQSIELDSALANLSAALELEPRHLATLVHLGQVEMERENGEAAREWFEKALLHDLTRAAGHQGLGQLAARQRDYETAVGHFEKALAIQPEASALHYPLGTAYRQLGDREKARLHFEQRGEQPVWVPDPLLEPLRQIGTGAGHFLSQGTTAFTQGDLEVAVFEYRKAVEVDPENLTARQALASALAQSGELEEALAELQVVLEQDPSNAFAHYNVATIQLTRGDIERAIPSFERAIELSPGYTDAHFNLATAFERLGRLDEAESHYASALATNPQDTDTRLLRARVLTRTGRLEEAVSELQTLLELDPHHVRARFSLGEVLVQLGDLPRALELFQSILEVERTPTESGLTHLKIAGLLAQEGSSEQALSHLRSAAELLPGRPDVYLTQARIAGRAGQFDTAEQAYARVLATDPNSQEALFGRSIALLLAGRHVEARKHLTSSLARQPGNLPLKHALARLLATSPDESARDGQSALELAKEVFQTQQSREHAETMAMAHAEVGSFEQAVAWQTRVISEAERAGQAQLLPLLRKRLALYREGKPCRSPWLEQG